MIEDARQHLVKTWLLKAANIEAIKTRNKEEVEEEIVNFTGKIVKEFLSSPYSFKLLTEIFLL